MSKEWKVKCCNCGGMYPERLMHYPGPTCDRCEEIEEMQWQDKWEFEKEQTNDNTSTH